MTNNLNIIILAAGKGTRMKSEKLKVLHPLAGKAIIDHVLDTAKLLNPNKIIMVYGHQGEQLKKYLEHENVVWVEQNNPQGTGHAVQLAAPFVDKNSSVLILVGDAPLIEFDDLQKLTQYKQAVLSAEMQNPFGYGRIIKNSENQIEAIVEEKDASQQQKQISEINSGIILAESENLQSWIQQIDNNNAQGEYYLTDVIGLGFKNNQPFSAVTVRDNRSIKGINDRVQLSECETILQTKYRKHLMLSGVSMPHPKTVEIRGQLTCGQDIEIDTGVILEGNNEIADNVSIGAYSIIKNCKLGKNTRIAPHSMLENVITKGDCDIGPFARLRPGTVIGEKAKVGNFVETKKTTIGYNSKASHLTYLGDSEIGDNVNIGAGTITCNYDGVNKFKTIIEDDVFIGSDTQLVAPVTVGKGATIGAGTTLTKNAESGKLTLSRARQKTIDGWQKPKKQ